MGKTMKECAFANAVVGLAALVGVSGCAGSVLYKEAPGATAPGSTQARERNPAQSEAIAVHDILYREQDINRAFGVIGYVLFPRIPNESERERHMAACTNFLRVIPSQAPGPDARVDFSRYMVTYWPYDGVFRATQITDIEANCEYLVKTDRHRLADTLVQRYGNRLGLEVFARRGPFLIAEAQGSRGEAVKPLFLDASAISEDQFEAMFAAWKVHIVEPPGQWNEGLLRTQIDLEFLSFIKPNFELIGNVYFAVLEGNLKAIVDPRK